MKLASVDDNKCFRSLTHQHETRVTSSMFALCFLQASFGNVQGQKSSPSQFCFLRSSLITVAVEERSKRGDFCTLFSALRHPIMHCEVSIAYSLYNI